MAPTSSGSAMLPVRMHGRHTPEKSPACDRVTVAFQKELRLKTEALAHKRIYGGADLPSLRDQASALIRAYVAAGQAGAAEQFLHDLRRAAKPDCHRPFGAEVMVQLASNQASEFVARQSLSMVRCRATAAAWLRHAYREISELCGSIDSVKAEYSL